MHKLAVAHFLHRCVICFHSVRPPLSWFPTSARTKLVNNNCQVWLINYMKSTMKLRDWLKTGTLGERRHQLSDTQDDTWWWLHKTHQVGQFYTVFLRISYSVRLPKIMKIGWSKLWARKKVSRFWDTVYKLCKMKAVRILFEERNI